MHVSVLTLVGGNIAAQSVMFGLPNNGSTSYFSTFHSPAVPASFDNSTEWLMGWHRAFLFTFKGLKKNSNNTKHFFQLLAKARCFVATKDDPVFPR